RGLRWWRSKSGIAPGKAFLRPWVCALTRLHGALCFVGSGVKAVIVSAHFRKGPKAACNALG
ncbi:MAG: hypothetical protein AAGF76_17625, partial [Pseudomonadota bacterium]